MAQAPDIDGVLIQWGDRLFFPGNRIVKVRPDPKLTGNSTRDRANAIRARIAAVVAPRVPQVMVKVTGGGRGMKAIAAHFRYISKNGRLDIEGERGEAMRGKDISRTAPSVHALLPAPAFATAKELPTSFLECSWESQGNCLDQLKGRRTEQASFADEQTGCVGPATTFPPRLRCGVQGHRLP